MQGEEERRSRPTGGGEVALGKERPKGAPSGQPRALATRRQKVRQRGGAERLVKGAVELWSANGGGRPGWGGGRRGGRGARSPWIGSRGRHDHAWRTRGSAEGGQQVWRDGIVLQE
jgi:hypothetical protein